MKKKSHMKVYLVYKTVGSQFTKQFWSSYYLVEIERNKATSFIFMNNYLILLLLEMSSLLVVVSFLVYS